VSAAVETAASRGFATCHVCLKLNERLAHRCSLCGAGLHARTPNSIQKTIALTLTAAVLYIPANVLPIMTTDMLGDSTDSTILGGVLVLIHHGDLPIAFVIFAASVMVPIGKLIALSWLCWSVTRPEAKSHRARTKLYRVMEFIGKWSMTDVFVVAILVALISLGGLMRITPGPAALAFGAMVVVTMLAAESFDPRLIWDQEHEGKASHG